MSETVTQEQIDTNYSYDEGDHDRFSHYVDRVKLMHSIFEGVPVRALCGLIWNPSRDAKRFPVCPECKELFEQLDN